MKHSGSRRRVSQLTTSAGPRTADARKRTGRARLVAAPRAAAGNAEALAHALVGASAAVTLFDRDWRIVFINQRSAEMLGAPREALVGRNLWEMYPGAAAGRAYHAFLRAMRDQVSVTVDQLSPNGARTLHCIAVPTPDGLLVVSRDVETSSGGAAAERADSLQPSVVDALERSDRRFRALIENGVDALLMVDADGRVLYASPRVFGAHGMLPAGEHLRLMRHVHPEDAARLRADVRRVLARHDERVAGSYRIRQRDGRWIWVEGIAHNLLHDAAVGAIVVNCRDVTEQRRAEDDLRFSEQHFRSLIEGALDLVTVVDDAGIVLYASPSHERVLGWKGDELVGHSVLQFVHPEDRRALVDAFVASDATLPSRRTESRVRHANGAWRIIESITHRSLDASPVGGFVVNARDVTERRSAERKTAMLLELARDLASTLDPQEVQERVGRRVAAALGCDLVGTCRWDAEADRYVVAPLFGEVPASVADLIHVPIAKGTRFLERLLEGPLVYGDPASQGGLLGEVSRRVGLKSLIAAPLRSSARHHGALIAASTRADVPIDDEHGALLTAIARQLAVVLERAELHRQREQDAELSAALAHIGRELLAELDSEQLPDRLCRTTAEALGCATVHTLAWRAEEQAYGLAAAHGVSRDALEALRVLRIPRALVDAVLGRHGADVVAVKSGGEGAGAALASILGVAPGCTLLAVALRRGSELIGVQTAVLDAPGAAFAPVQLKIAGGLAHLASLALEHVRVMEQLSRANRLKSDFVAMISHELRTPLNVILGYSDLLLDQTFGPLRAEQLDALRSIHARGHELLQLIREVLDLSRLDSGRIPLDLTPVALPGLLAAVEQSVRPLERVGEVELRVAVAPDVGVLLTDPTKLSVTLKNLLANAFKFTSRGSVTLGARRTADGVSFTVADTGIGIPPDQLQIIFEPFRQGDPTLTRRHGGVGLGLHIVRRMVELLGGTVRVESTQGTGSTFEVWLPDDLHRTSAPRAAAGAETPASTDAVTGLPGPTVIHERITAALRAGDPRHVACAVLYVTVDVAESAPGTLAGLDRDALLCMVGERFASVLRTTDTVARAGGDDFVVLLPGRATPARIEELARRLLGTLDAPLLVAGRNESVRGVIGAVLASGAPAEPDVLVDRARRAATRARDRGIKIRLCSRRA